MGNKHGSVKKGSSTSLNPQERRRLTVFLQQNKQRSNFTRSDMKMLWSEILVPDLLSSYADFILKFSSEQNETVDADDFVIPYKLLVRGSSEEKIGALTEIIGSSKNSQGLPIISYKSLCKYLSDLLDSYFMGLKSRNDAAYKTWTQKSEPKRTAIELITTGICNDLKRTGDEISIDLMERWLHECGIINTLHTYVLGIMYNLEPEHDSYMIPLAEIPSKRMSILLDISQVLYLNSFLLSEFKLEWRLLFSTYSHGESFSKLESCITNQGPILLVIETNSNHMFGGFISTNITLSPKWIGSEDCFLFKVYPTVDVYPATGYNDHYAYVNSHQTTMPNGLGMGGQYSYWGLWIDSQFGVGECSESCTTYKNYRMLDPNKKFHIKRLEVWGVGDPPPTDEEKGERTVSRTGTRVGPSVLDRDSATTHLFEMAGRTMHSKGLREEK